MRFSFSSHSPQSGSLRDSKVRLRLQAHWRMVALGCVAAGGVGVLWLPSVAQQGPAIVPDNTAAPVVAPLPEMTATTNAPVPNSTLPNSTLPNSALPNSVLPDTFAPAATARRGKVNFASDIPQPATQESRISLEMRDTPVIDLLMLIAAQADVQITIGTDVEQNLAVRGIRLKDVTPEEAIRETATAAGLRWRKNGDTAYFVGKSLPSDGNRGGAYASADAGIKPINEGWLDTNAQSLQAAPQLSPYNPPARSNGGNGNFNYSNSLVPLAGTNKRVEKDIARIRVRNVRSALMAYWIDPKNQPMPVEIQASEKAKSQGLNPYPLLPGADPNVMAALNGRGAANSLYGNPYAANNFANPYLNVGAANPWMQPMYRSNFLFGGGGNTGGGFGGGGGGFGGNRGGGGSGGSGVGLLELGTDPETGAQLVDQIISVDAQNVLLVYGTTEGIRKLNEIIEFLDRPIRQVEIESQFIDISVNQSDGFGIQFFNRGSTRSTPGTVGALPDASGTNTIVITRGDFQARIQALTSSGKARIINSPRVTTMNNLTASLISQQQTPVVLTSTETGIGGQVGEQQNAFFLTTIIGIQVTPTIQNDDTVTVFLTPQVSVQIPNPTLGGVVGDDDDDDDNNNGSSAGSIPAVSSQSVSTVANVKDNDVIVIGGLRTRTQNIVKSRIPVLSKIPIIGRLFRSSSVTDTDRELVIFLTARILRRTDDVTPIQGP
jgi:hypothetical protein